MNTKLIKPLLKKGKLDWTMWLEILEGLRSEVTPKLSRYKLPTFGELACIGPNSGDRYELLYDTERKVNISVHNKPGVRMSNGADNTCYSLSDHAISYFRDTGRRVDTSMDVRIFYAWGLTKHGNWVLIEICVQGTRIKDKIFEVPYEVTFQNVSLEEMLEKSEVTPFSVLSSIGLEVERYAGRKRVISQDADRFAADVKALENTILHEFI